MSARENQLQVDLFPLFYREALVRRILSQPPGGRYGGHLCRIIFIPGDMSFPKDVFNACQCECRFFVRGRLEKEQRSRHVRLFGESRHLFRRELMVERHLGDTVNKRDIPGEEVIDDTVRKSLKIRRCRWHYQHQNISPNEGVGMFFSASAFVRKAVRSWPELGSSSL